MIPAKITITGNTDVDTATAELAVHLRNSGMTERQAISEAQRYRNTFLTAALTSPATGVQALLPDTPEDKRCSRTHRRTPNEQA